MSFDHGELNIPLHKRPSLDAQIDRALAEQRREKAIANRAAIAKRKAAREAEKSRPKLTADDLRGATLVRDSLGWHHVVRVSAKSVTVATPYSWTDRIPLDRILEVRAT